MKKVRIISAEEAALLVNDGDTISTGGFVSSACPEALSKAVEKRFLETGHPRDLTLFFAAGQGHRDGTGGDHYGHEGMVKRVIGGHWDRAASLGALALENKIEAYNLPQGVISHMYRDIAAHKLGTITHVGLYTFVDPRNGGGKLNSATTEDIVKIVNIEGQERLLYKSFPINVVFVRGSYADEYGNCTVHHEIGPIDVTAMTQACRNSGGKVIVQVEKVVQGGTLDPKLVAIPGIYVDAIVIGSAEDNMQCLGTPYDGSLTGEYRIPMDAIPAIPLDAKKIIARRAAMELKGHSVINLGIGVPEGVGVVADQEGIRDQLTLSIESGPVGGIPSSGVAFGTSLNPEAILDQSTQFDGYTGGSLDITFLGLAEADRMGNINVSKFGARVSGAGGFIDITQSTKNVVFCGTFTAGGLKTAAENGKLVIVQEGRTAKLVEQVQQITFNGPYAAKCGQHVLYITERAVFELRPEGMTLIEIAPGIDLQTQVLDHMGFVPRIADDLKLMDVVAGAGACRPRKGVYQRGFSHIGHSRAQHAHGFVHAAGARLFHCGACKPFKSGQNIRPADAAAAYGHYLVPLGAEFLNPFLCKRRVGKIRLIKHRKHLLVFKQTVKVGVAGAVRNTGVQHKNRYIYKTQVFAQHTLCGGHMSGIPVYLHYCPRLPLKNGAFLLSACANRLRGRGV